MKKLVFLLVAFTAVLLLSCEGEKFSVEMLQKAEACMEGNPEEALKILDSLTQGDLSRRRLQAKYSLLMSMALDKNYIDVDNDSIIHPAVEYYKRRGPADDRLKTWYYWGRIAMNTGEYETAISRLTIAEKYVRRASDQVAVGRLYKAQTSVYQYCYDTDAMIEAAGKAAALYKSIGDTTKYIASLLDITAGYLNEEDTVNAEATLSLAKECWPAMNERLKSQYFANCLILGGRKASSNLNELLSEYEREIANPQLVQWLTVAKAYHKCGEYTEALEALENYEYYGGKMDDAFCWISGLVYEALDRQSEAMSCYRNYIELTDEKLGYLLEADIRFVKERYETRIALVHRTYFLIVLVLCVIVLILSTVLVTSRIRRINREKRITEEKLKENVDKYARMYEAALIEIDNLKDVLARDSLDKSVREHLGRRLGLLNRFIASNMTPNYSFGTAAELEQLMKDKSYFIESTRVSFLIENPDFIAYLKQKGLSDGEIGYCCLYAIGLKGKDISAYLGKGHYKLSSSIRKKLGLSEHDTNLDIFLREKCLGSKK
ncbi:MAG: hypothetical protein ACI3ZP_04755 [Candidatus Cryptobacteroides sp.]